MKQVRFLQNSKNNLIFYVSILISILVHVFVLVDSTKVEKSMNMLETKQSKFTYVSFTIEDNFITDKSKSFSETKKLLSDKGDFFSKNTGKKMQTSLSKEQSKKILQTYEQSILKKIHENKYYPLSAKKMQMKGVIKLKFVLKSDGSLRSKVQIIDRCKHQILNEASLKTIHLASPFLPFPEEIKLQQKTFIVKIKYRQNRL